MIAFTDPACAVEEAVFLADNTGKPHGIYTTNSGGLRVRPYQGDDNYIELVRPTCALVPPKKPRRRKK